MSRRGWLIYLEDEQRRTDDQVLVTVGRAARMLRVRRGTVRWYVEAGQLANETVEGTCRLQLVFRKGEIRRFLLARAERRGRRPPTYAPQLALQFVRPVMLKAGLAQAKPNLYERTGKDRGNAKRSGRVA